MIKYYFNSDNNIIKLIKQKVIILNGDITKKHLGIDEHTYKNLKNKLSSKNVTNVIFITWKTITFGTYVHVFIMINYNCN